MTATTQTVEARFTGDGRVAVTIDPPGTAVEQAGSAGTAAGRQVVRTALETAAGPALRRAGELLQEVQAADRTLAEHEAVAAAIDRQAVEAAGLQFGPALDARLTQLDEERAAEADRSAAVGRRADALRELHALRDGVLSGGVGVVETAVGGRLKAAAAERERTAARLAATVAGELARLAA